MSDDSQNDLEHYGTPRHSGRYPWGSGKDPQRNTDFLTNYHDLKKKGMTDKQIAEGMALKTGELRARVMIERGRQRREDVVIATKLREKGLSHAEIGKRMGGRNESSIRALLDPAIQAKADVAESTANMLRKIVDEKNFVDVGAGVESHLGISKTKVIAALYLLEQEGYKIQYDKMNQQGTGKPTSYKILTHKDTPWKDVHAAMQENRIATAFEHYTKDGGKTWNPIEPPAQVDSRRIHIRYNEDGGKLKDGVLELRRGVPDLSLGNVNYAQVRVGVDGTHFMKGMAIYADDMPAGIDIIYNTNKKRGTPKEDVFKSLKDETKEVNVFGSIVRQNKYIGADGKEHLSALNIVGSKPGSGEEGGWETWSRNLSSQVLSKQTPALAKKQLGLAYDLKKEEFEEIMSLTNPAIKKHLLDSFASDCDASAVHLKAAPLPGQGTHVILPLLSLKEREVYAPNYKPGDTVVLIRHPHGGTFEIPELIVTDKNPEGKRLIGKAKDAVGINPKVAEKLSGADFDGDTVIVIPNNNGAIRSKPTLDALNDYDPKLLYQDKSLPKMKGKTKQMEMGKITNLITDMTIGAASTDEIARAVRHSMVVIDAEKHSLDYKRSAKDHNIAALKKKYQGSDKAGSSTLISRAGSDLRVPIRKPAYVLNPKTGKRSSVDPETGKKVYDYLLNEKYTDEKGHTKYRTVRTMEEAKRLGGQTYTTYVMDKKGRSITDPKTGKVRYLDVKGTKQVMRTIKSTKMDEVDDAFKLSSGTRMETVYAEHANSLKALANKARLTAINIEDTPYNPAAYKTYAKEVAALKADLDRANKNKPLERQAQLLANKAVEAKKQENPFLDADDLKKIKGQELIIARHRVGAQKEPITIDDRKWEAIQAGAISSHALDEIILNIKPEILKERAMPRTTKGLSSGKIARAKLMFEHGYDAGEIADSLGVSTSTLRKALE